MEVALSVARIVLAAVFALAAVTKLADLDGARRAARDFGVPERLAPAVGTLLPVAELAAALLLLPAETAVAGAALALALLLAFTTAIAVSLARGETPDCHCFGQLHSAPAGPATLIRNGALAALAAFVLVGSLAEEPAGAFGWIGDLTAYYQTLDKKKLWDDLPNVVIIDDGNGYRSIYAHMSAVSVAVGQRVKGGSKIGKEGATGHASGCHVHYGLFSPLEKTKMGLHPDTAKRMKLPRWEVARVNPLLVLPYREGISPAR